VQLIRIARRRHRDRRLRKVLSIERSDSGDMTVFSYRAGPWERLLAPLRDSETARQRVVSDS
jgi:hypothetical protein